MKVGGSGDTSLTGSSEIKIYILHSDTFFEFLENGRPVERFNWWLPITDRSRTSKRIIWARFRPERCAGRDHFVVITLETTDEVIQGQLTSDAPELNIPSQHHLVWGWAWTSILPLFLLPWVFFSVCTPPNTHTHHVLQHAPSFIPFFVELHALTWTKFLCLDVGEEL